MSVVAAAAAALAAPPRDYLPSMSPGVLPVAPPSPPSSFGTPPPAASDDEGDDARPPALEPAATCALPGCSRPVFIDFDGVAFPFCGRSHGRAYQRLPDSIVLAPAPEASICAWPGCDKAVHPPEASSSTPYRCCGRRHAIALELEHRRLLAAVHPPRVIIDHSTIPVLPHNADEDVPPVIVPAAVPAPPPAVSVVPPPGLTPAVANRVFRQRHWMARQLAARTSPRPCAFNGSRLCPICRAPFRVGQEMVKCYVQEASGAPPWIHLDCANAIIVARGAPGLLA
mmetsp:Transcript_30389/g.62616  ORF Transcript_30389/g.62616 Transcript_30389/m.62616 type:complete len:284 (-) Transcript_30389:112-963(-)